MKELIAIQNELKAPKSNRNNFGNYNYRSCEDILEAVKPLCEKYNCLLTISDEMIMLGERFYVKATATIRCNKADDINIEGIGTVVPVNADRKISVSAYARESLSKKGMDESQITGSASSYARKYALNGLFCIDDTKDADTMDNRPQANSAPINVPVVYVTNRQKSIFKDYLAKLTKLNDSKAMKHLSVHMDNDNLTEFEAEKIIADIKKYLGE